MLLAAQAFLWLVFYSFAGWTYESILCSVTEKKLVNRGFLNGPLCPIYGFGALFIIFVLGWGDNNPVSIFLSSAVLACALEYFTSWAMEKLFHARWWDYSQMRFNLNGRICLAGFVLFGLFGLVLLKWIHPWVAANVASLSEPMTWMLTGALLALTASDAFSTVRHVLRLNERLCAVQDEIERFVAEAKAQGEQWALEANLAVGQLRNSTEEQRAEWRAQLLERFEGEARAHTEKMRFLMERRQFQDRRLFAAFPNLRHSRADAAWEELKKRLLQAGPSKTDEESKENG